MVPLLWTLSLSSFYFASPTFLMTSIFSITYFLSSSRNNMNNSVCIHVFNVTLPSQKSKLCEHRIWVKFYSIHYFQNLTQCWEYCSRPVNIWRTNEQKFHQFHFPQFSELNSNFRLENDSSWELERTFEMEYFMTTYLKKAKWMP